MSVVPQSYFAAPARGGSVLMTRVGGRTYPTKTAPNCKTCHSQYRTQIENALLKSYGYTAIAKSLPEDAGLNARNIMDHFNAGHLPIDESVRRVMIEEDARERGLDIEGFESTLANHITFAKLGVQKVMQKMMEGELNPDISDGIAFASLLMKIEEQAGDSFDTEALMQGFMVYMNAIRAVCSPAQEQQIINTISANPVMRALLSRDAQQRETVAGEVEAVGS